MFYPDRQVNPKFNQGPIIKPLLPVQQPVKQQPLRYSKFGHNLGPSAPVVAKTKYHQGQQIHQSPMLMSAKARQDTASHYLINQNMLVQKIQDRMNEARSAYISKTAAKSTPRQSKSQVGVANLTYRHQGVTNVLQSPNYFRSYSRPSDSKAVDKFYRSVEKQVAESKRVTQEFYQKGEPRPKDMTEAKKKSPFLFSSLRKLVSSEPQLSQSERQRHRSMVTKSMTNMFDLKGPDRGTFVKAYKNHTQMLQRGQSKVLASTSTLAKTMPCATKEDRRPQTAFNDLGAMERFESPYQARNESAVISRRKTQPEFFKTHYQHAIDQHKVGNSYNKNKVEQFCFTRYKQKARSNYDSVPAGSRYKDLDYRQPDFQMRITVDNGEPGIPISQSTVYKPIPDQQRFVSIYQPQQDVFKENMCHSFVSVQHNRTLKKSAQKALELQLNRDRWTQLGMKRKQGGGLFKQRVPPKPKHAIDFI